MDLSLYHQRQPQVMLQIQSLILMDGGGVRLDISFPFIQVVFPPVSLKTVIITDRGCTIRGSKGLSGRDKTDSQRKSSGRKICID